MWMTQFRSWWHHFYVGARRFCKSIVDVGDQMDRAVTNISKLSPTHFVSNIRHQHRTTFSAKTCNFLKMQLQSSSHNSTYIYATQTMQLNYHQTQTITSATHHYLYANKKDETFLRSKNFYWIAILQYITFKSRRLGS